MSITLPLSLKDTLPDSIAIDWELLQEAHQQAPANAVRLNPRKYTTRFDHEQKIPWTELGRYLQQRPSYTFDPLFHAGTYYVQEASSMFVEFALRQHVDFSENLTVLDLCAAPGGKSTHIASLLSDESLLISNEVIGTRVNILVENMSKWGYNNTWVSNNDPSHFKKIPSFFDILMVDAPCSGSGLFRKIPAYCNSWNTDMVALCAQRQKRILHDAYTSLAENGIIVYMTCSLSKDENEDMVDFILQQFEVESLRVSLHSKMGIVETVSEQSAGWGYRFFPHLLQGEGFFLALFRKKDGSEKEVLKETASRQSKAFDVSRYINNDNHFTFLQSENLISIRDSHKDVYSFLHNKIKIVKKGILLGRQLPGDLIPSHELALYTHCKYDDHVVQLDLRNAVAYLKKEHVDVSLAQKGWYLVTYNNFAIGWLKNLGNRINNYYPSNYRILSQNILPF